MKRFLVCFAVFAAMFLMVGCQNKSQGNNESQTGNESQVKKGAKIELEWSSVSDRKMKWNQAVRYCKNLVEDGHDDWRLPSVDEFRTTISPEYFPWNAVGGICSLSDQNDCLSASCWNDNASCCNSTASLAAALLYLQTRCPASSCSDEYLNTHPEIKKKMEKLISMAKSAKALWTSSVVSDENTYSWTFALMSGFMLDMAQDIEGLVQMDSSKNYVQCVRGKLPENIIIVKNDGPGADFIKENAKEFMAKNGKNPTTTSSRTETKAKKESAEPTKIGDLTWSSKANTPMNWNDAVVYCKNLNEGGYSDWRLPNIDELRTLIQNCPGTVTGGSCQISEKNGCLHNKKCWSKKACQGCSKDSSGKHSKLGDTDLLWSSSFLSNGSDSNWGVGFDYGNLYHNWNVHSNSVRCVRGSQTETKVKKESSETTKIGNLLWSSNASDKMKWSSAVKYCKNLNEGGYSNWRLPNIDELRTLIQNCSGTESGGACQASEKNDCLSSECWTSEDCTSCAGDSSKEYSKLGDTDWYWSSSTFSDNTESAFGVNFDNGIVGKQLRKTHYYKVRCVK